MEAQIESMDWSTIFHSTELDGIVEGFIKFLLRLVEDFVPTKWIKITSDIRLWFSNKSWLAIKDVSWNAVSWKLFILTPRMLLGPTEESGTVGKQIFNDRMRKYLKGEWVELLNECVCNEQGIGKL